MIGFGDYDPIRLRHQDSPETIKVLVDECLYPHKTFSTFTYRSAPRGTDFHELEHPELTAKFARYFVNLARISKGCVFPFFFVSTNRNRPHAHAIITSEKPLPFELSGKILHRGDCIIHPVIREIGRTQHQLFDPEKAGVFYQSISHIHEPFSPFTPSSRKKPRLPFPPSILETFYDAQTIRALNHLV